MTAGSEVMILFYLPFSSSRGESEVREHYAGYGDALEELRRKDFTSDILFNIGMRHGTEMAEYIARTVTGEAGLRIERVWTQYRIENIGHSVILDALAEDSEGRLISYEMQKGEEPDLEGRRRIYEGSLSIAFLGKGERYCAVPRQISIFLLNKDIHRRGKAVYHSMWRDDECLVTDWSMERYEVNMGYEGLDTEAGRMIHDIRCARAEEMLTEVLRKRMNEIKNTEEGRMEYMSDSARLIAKGEARGRAEGRVEGQRKSIETMLRDGLATPEQIAKSFDMSLSEVIKIAESLK